VVGVGSLEKEAEPKLAAFHIQDGCYGGHIENTKSAITPEEIARVGKKFYPG
jgi:hypothetical protein